MRNNNALLLAIGFLVLTAGSARAAQYTLDFETVGHGEVIGQQSNEMMTFRPLASGEKGVTFDRNASGTRDADRQYGAGGVFPGVGASEVASLLLIRESIRGCSDAGIDICDDPDTRGTRAQPTGTVNVEFTTATSIGFDLIDVAGAASTTGTGFVELHLTGDRAGRLVFSGLANYRTGVVWGYDSVSRIAPLVASGGQTFDKVVFGFSGSGGLDNIVWTDDTPEPPDSTVSEPATLVVLGLGLSALGMRRRAASLSPLRKPAGHGAHRGRRGGLPSPAPTLPRRTHLAGRPPGFDLAPGARPGLAPAPCGRRPGPRPA